MLPAAALLLLWPAATVTHERWTSNLNGPKLSDLFLSDTAHRYNRRSNLENHLVKPAFYDPYHHQGDAVYLRTTPKVIVDYTKPFYEGEENKFYNAARIEDFRECNFICPELYKRFGEICGWRLRFNSTWQWRYEIKYLWWWTDGYYNSIDYKTFDDLCQMQLENCKEHSIKPGSTQTGWDIIRALWRLVHVGACPENDTKNELVWDDDNYKLGWNVNFWKTKSDDILKTSNDKAYKTKALPKG